MEKITVATIVWDYVKEHGYDGLYNPTLECACFKPESRAIYLGLCPTADCIPGYDTRDDPKCEFIVGPKKMVKKKKGGGKKDET